MRREAKKRIVIKYRAKGVPFCLTAEFNAYSECSAWCLLMDKCKEEKMELLEIVETTIYKK